MKRSYKLKDRAAGQAQTRQKIIDATVALHQEKGLVATSVSDIAKRAGVGKVTVYRHFPDETALVSACSGEYFELHPFPDPASWDMSQGIRACLRHCLRDVYAFHEDTAPMMRKVLAEARDHPVVEPYHEYWRLTAEAVASALPAKQRDEKLMAALALALSFDTWHLLVQEQGLSADKAIDMMVRLVCD